MKGRRQMKVAMEIAGFAPTPRNEPKLGLQLRDLGEMMPCVQVGHTPPTRQQAGRLMQTCTAFGASKWSRYAR
jgi:hypothetical protein